MIRSFLRNSHIRRCMPVAVLLAFLGALIFPAIASAQPLLPHLASTASAIGYYTGEIDGSTLFNFVMTTLVELVALFWVGAQLWLNFVLQPAAERYKDDERGVNAQVEQRFERRFSLPLLLVLLLANIGVFVGQSLILANGDWGRIFSSTVLTQVTNSRFGAYMLMREIVIVLAIAVAVYMLLVQQRPKLVAMLLPLINLLLGTALFIAITMSSNATVVNSSLVPFAIVLDWLHLLASALWIGGIFYIAIVYLPALKKQGIVTTARSLTRVLPYAATLAIVGIIVLSITGPFSADFHLNSWDQLTGTAYGRSLLVKIGLTAVLLITSIIQIGILRPSVKREYQKYRFAAERLAALEPDTYKDQEVTPVKIAGQEVRESNKSGAAPADIPSKPEMMSGSAGEHDIISRRLAKQVRLREQRLTGKTNRLASILRWEMLLGAALIVCVGLMSAFGGTVLPTAAQQTHGSTHAFTTTVSTSDGKFKATLVVNPNRFGTNVFTVSVVDTATSQPVTNQIRVVISTTMLDMDMGTNDINLLPDGKGHFSASGDLDMPGNWQFRIVIHTADNALHVASVTLAVPF